MKPVLTSLFLGAVFSSAAAFADVREIAIGVSDAFIPRTRAGAEASVIVSGVFPNGCYRWSRATVAHLPGDLHEIRSFANVQSGMCIMVLVPFNKEVVLGRLGAGTHRLRFVNGDGTYMEKQLKVE